MGISILAIPSIDTISFPDNTIFFKYFINKHDYVINGRAALQPMVERILELNPEMRSRAKRACELVTMGAISRHPTEGYTCWTKSHPTTPYHIRRNQNNGLWECTCPDENAPTMTVKQRHRTVELPVCKHLLAAMMAYRLRQANGLVWRKAAASRSSVRNQFSNIEMRA